MFYDTLTESASIVDFSQIPDFKYECNYEGALMSIYEAECNFNNIMKAAGISELKYFKENNGGDLFMEQEGARESFAERVLAWFKEKLETIWAFIKKWALTFKNAFADIDKFAAKYKPVIEKADIPTFKFKGFKFTGIGDVQKFDFMPFNGEGPLSADAMRGIVCKAGGDVSAKEFAAKYNALLKGSESAEDLDISKSDVLATFGKLNKASISSKVKAAEKSGKYVEGVYKTLSADLKKNKKEKDYVDQTTPKVKAYKDQMTVLHKAIAIYTSALAAETKQSKAIILTALSKIKKAPKEED